MRAVKGNREYTVNEDTKQQYIKDGFDIYDDEGNKITAGQGRTVSQQEYDKLLDELQEAKKSTLSDSEVIPILKEYADMKGIDIGQASTPKGIYSKIKDAAENGG